MRMHRHALWGNSSANLSLCLGLEALAFPGQPLKLCLQCHGHLHAMCNERIAMLQGLRYAYARSVIVIGAGFL